MAYGLTAYNGSNVYVPSLEASGYVIQYTRKPESFVINDYVQYKQVDHETGKYVRIKPEQAGRVVTLQDFAWPDGADAPQPNASINNDQFDYATWFTKRYTFDYTLGDLTVQQAAWNILAEHSADVMQQCMTHRTIATWNAINTTANWGANTATATALGGGQWSAATSANQYIRKGIAQAVENIMLGSLGVVGYGDLRLVISPDLARVMAITDEIVGYVKASPFSVESLRYSQNFNLYGLPDVLYGVKLVIEKTVKVASRKVSSGSPIAGTFVVPSTTAALVSRPGSLDGGPAGGPSFSTIGVFFKEEATVEQMQDVNNRRTNGRVTTNFDVQIVAPQSGYLITSAA